MSNYKVYLNGINGREKFEFNDKEKVREFIKDSRNKENEDGKKIYDTYMIIMRLEGTDTPISRGTFTEAEVIVDGLDDEWRIQNGSIINYTKFQRAQEENAKNRKTQGGDER